MDALSSFDLTLAVKMAWGRASDKPLADDNPLTDACMCYHMLPYPITLRLTM